MRKLKRVLVVCAVVSGVGTAAAQAQGVEFGLGGGLAIPTSNALKGTYKTGYNLQASASFTLPGKFPFGVQLDGNFIRNNVKNVSLKPQKLQIISGTANLVYKFKTSETAAIRPYIIAGGGVYNLDTKDAPAGPGAGSTTKFGVNAGAGFDFKAGPVGAFVEGRFHNVFSSFDAFDTSTSTTTRTAANYVLVTAGIRFGGK